MAHKSVAHILSALFVFVFISTPGSAQAAPIELVSPNEENAGEFGISVSGVPDVNGDGLGDVVIGARGESPGASPDDAGRVYIIDGATGVLLRTLSSPNEEEGGNFGRSVSGVADVNGDGFGDIVVGAPGEDPGGSPSGAGRAYIFDGATGAPLRTLASLNQESGGAFGYSVSGVSDIDGDGRGDVVVGAFVESPGASPEAAGRAYIFGGATGSLLQTLASPNEGYHSFFGRSVSGVSDANGDGRGDVVVGARGDTPAASPNFAGRAYIFDGATGGLLQTLASPNEENNGYFGGAVSGVPDTNGDGRGDVVIGAEQEDPGESPFDAGRAYIFDGATGALLQTLASPNETSAGNFGGSVSGVPDTNGDGRGDVVIGVDLGSENHGSPPGSAHIFDGATGSLLRSLFSPNEEVNGSFANSVSGIEDVNNDGRGDVVIGAHFENPGASPYNAGRAYIFNSSVEPLEVHNWSLY